MKLLSSSRQALLKQESYRANVSKTTIDSRRYEYSSSCCDEVDSYLSMLLDYQSYAHYRSNRYIIDTEFMIESNKQLEKNILKTLHNFMRATESQMITLFTDLRIAIAKKRLNVINN